MFETGDYIIYGNNGVCRVEDIGTLDISGVQKGQLYYTLQPVYSKGSKVFTPVNNDKVIMRPILTESEAKKIIDGIGEIDELWIEDDAKRDSAYKESIKKCDCTEWIKLIKTLYVRKQNRMTEGRKIAAGDERYRRQAEDNLYGELAISLHIDRNKVEDYIISRVEGEE